MTHKTAKELGYKVGDKFKFISKGKQGYGEASCMNKIFVLTNDDESECPEFKELGYIAAESDFFYFDQLEKIEENVEVNKQIDFTKPLETTCGMPFELLSTRYRSSNSKFNIIGYIDDSKTLSYFTNSGVCASGNYILRNVALKKECEVWVNIYKNSNNEIDSGYSTYYACKDSANDFANSERVACIRVPFTAVEGRFDE